MSIDRETVIRLAEEAGMARPMEIGVNDLWAADDSDLQRFAALVLEHGRKPLTEIDCLISLENTAVNDYGFSVAQRVRIVRAVEAAHGIANKEPT